MASDGYYDQESLLIEMNLADKKSNRIISEENNYNITATFKYTGDWGVAEVQRPHQLPGHVLLQGQRQPQRRHLQRVDALREPQAAQFYEAGEAVTAFIHPLRSQCYQHKNSVMDTLSSEFTSYGTAA